jgi:aromatic ring-cleaving dioxygenase
VKQVRPIGDIVSYHAHVYYDAAMRAVAERLRERVGERFAVRLGRWHDKPVGPHPISMFQIAFDVAEFATLVPWLMLNREGLTILVHPNTESPRKDHEINPLWLGSMLDLSTAQLPDFEEEHTVVEVNTTPTLAP